MIETPQERATAGMLEKAEAALRTLLDKMERIEASEAYRSVWIVAQIHSGPYHGENWAVERNAARAALRDTAPPSRATVGLCVCGQCAACLDYRAAARDETRILYPACNITELGDWPKAPAQPERHWQNDADPNPGREQTAYQTRVERGKP